VLVDAHSRRWICAPRAARLAHRSDAYSSFEPWYVSFAFAIAAFPARCLAIGESSAASRASTAESMRLMKKLATDATRETSPPAARRSSSPATYAIERDHDRRRHSVDAARTSTKEAAIVLTA